MALQKEFSDSIGNNYPEGYWKIVGLFTDYVANTGRIIVSGYKDQNSRNELKQPAQTINIEIKNKTPDDATVFADLFGTETLSKEGITPLSSVYNYLKTTPKFENSVDV